MNTREFFEKLKPWSERKHRLLEKYLPPFSAKVATTTQNREVFCVDAFAGAAKYDDGKEGSPLLIARFSDVCANWKNPVNLRLINVEPDTANVGIFDSLESATQVWKDRGIIQNIRSEFFPALPQILKIIGQQPALFFIDPFGPTQVHFSHLHKIFTRPQKITELILNFNAFGLHRIARAALSPNSNIKVAHTDLKLVTEILGSSEWVEKFQDPHLTTQEGEVILLHEYLNNIRKHGYEVVAYQIRESLTMRPQYYFVYCTRHRDGIFLMSDFIREEEDLLYRDHVDSNLPLFSDEASLSKAVDNRRRLLRETVEVYLRSNPVVSRGKIISDLLPINFGIFHSKDLKAVVQEMIRDKVLAEQSGKTRINDSDVLQFEPLL